MKQYKKHTNLTRSILLCLLSGATMFYTAPVINAAAPVVANNQLPAGGQSITGNHNGINNIENPDVNPVMNIHQTGQNGVIKWNTFDIGGNAVVNFSADKNGFNTLNYVNGGAASQIYGTINAQNGNIYIVNPSGVQIGPSAQLNAGSLYISNKYLDENKLAQFNGQNISALTDTAKTPTNAELMNLGNINASRVTFEGDGRIIIDAERIHDTANKNNLDYKNISVTAADTGDVIIGYKGYDQDSKTYVINLNSNIATVNGKVFSQSEGYSWVENAEQLQAIDTKLDGKYALRNGIDATATAEWNGGRGFSPLGIDENGKVIDGKGFTGKFDGLNHNIFGLTINDEYATNVGLFGTATGASINNVTLVGGSISGGEHVGAVVGTALNGTVIKNSANSAYVTGKSSLGGIVGTAESSTLTNVFNTGTIEGTGENPQGSGNVGGIAGYLINGSTVNGNSYNIGDISSVSSNVGGIAGKAENSVIGNSDSKQVIYNRLDVTGTYNVGGIIGNMENSTVQNAENTGNVQATGFIKDNYIYHSSFGGSIENATKSPTGKTNGDSMGTYKEYIVTAQNIHNANAGGITGSSSNSNIVNVLNTADINSNKQSGNSYYDAGNVGGIVGKAVDTNITNATNRENKVRGASNVGGIAGYFTDSGSNDAAHTIRAGINDDGDIMGTGMRNDTGFAKEQIRGLTSGNEKTNTGNIGGVVGYMYGDGAYITNSINGGVVHSLDLSGNTVNEASQASNIGGIVGKIDRSQTISLTDLQNDNGNAAVNNSYNVDNVRGYLGVGGIAGMMYNGEIAHSYNLGHVNTTRTPVAGGGDNFTVNMGGIVGDTTENSNADAVVYDVQNKGEIGDKSFTYYARHVGGIVGRLSGEVDRASNSGDIYNGYNVVGGIAGWVRKGSITNSFNTGNITVINNSTNSDLSTYSQVGGIMGSVDSTNQVILKNVYNLGTLRSFNNNTTNGNIIGGIVGRIAKNGNKLTIENAYTTGNIYAAELLRNQETRYIGSIYGYKDNANSAAQINNVYYITPEDTVNFKDLSHMSNQHTGVINYSDRDKQAAWKDFVFSDSVSGSSGDWRIYDKSTPIINSFISNTEKYLSDAQNRPSGNFSVQYGTAYDPMLTIIKSDKDLTLDWKKLNISGTDGIAVYGSGLTLNNFDIPGGTYYNGTLYSDGALTLNTSGAAPGKTAGHISMGSKAQIYGSSVSINSEGNVTIHGDIVSTGNTDGGDINITAGHIDIYGTLSSAQKGRTVTIDGIAGTSSENWQAGNVSDKNAVLNSISSRFAHTTENAASQNGNIIISTEQADGDGNVNLYYGNNESDLTTTGGDFTVKSKGSIYIDSDLDIGNNLNLTAADEIVLDVTNIGKVQAKNGTSSEADYLKAFMQHFSDNGEIIFNTKTGDAKIAVDIWDKETGSYSLQRYNELTNLNAKSNGQAVDVKKSAYIWVNSAEQMQGLQNFYSAYKDNPSVQDILSYNYALKNDINASNLADYVPVASGSEFNGIFDGRGKSIIGLDATWTADPSQQKIPQKAGIYAAIGENGIVRNLNIYSSDFEGTDTTGIIAGVNKGKIENVTGFGNHVRVSGSEASTMIDGKAVGAAGGVVGINSGTIDNARGDDIVTAGISKDSNTAVTTAGGITGINNGTVKNSFTNSAVVAIAENTYAIGGIAGTSSKTLDNVGSFGATVGIYKGDTPNYSDNVGGVVGINDGDLSKAYNESIVSGRNFVGGLIGVNKGEKTVTNIVNASTVTGEDNNSSSQYVGGLIGSNDSDIMNGRNNGKISGNMYVGGIVGQNGQSSVLKNLVNDNSASIDGDIYVGGIAGSNKGTIYAMDKTAGSEPYLLNRGTITGQQYVGGIAGVNEKGGYIENPNNDVKMFVKDASLTGNDAAKYFGGVAGKNEAGATISNATNMADIIADSAAYVGGIVGSNQGELKNLAGNTGKVTGKDFVGGVAGSNNAEITGVVAYNEGEVLAASGGAGGILAENTGAITNSWLSNQGNVYGKDSNKNIYGTGGIIGVNGGNITGSVMENTSNVTVSGESYTGGIMGYNTGMVNFSTLKNEADINVSGDLHDIGGLVGYNEGTLIGGRDAQNLYYKYQIYNTGTITANGKAENIGGLAGTNAGKITAAYNAGAVNAARSENVGGIAGLNTGSIDKVFNTVISGIDGNGKTLYGIVAGSSNTGGLVGANSGFLTNSYNTTNVKSGTNSGNIAGNNNGTVEKVYAANENGVLIGTGSSDDIKNSYSFSAEDANKTGITVLSSDKQKKKTGYTEFFTSDNNSDDWRIYDDYSTPLLKVFLTTLKINSDKVGSFAYDGKDHDLALDKLIGDSPNGTEAIPGFSVSISNDRNDLPKYAAFSSLSAYLDTINNKDIPHHKGDSFLLGNTDGQIDVNSAGYSNWLFSQQIAAAKTKQGFKSVLGYDVIYVTDGHGPKIVPDEPIIPDIPDISPDNHWEYLYTDAPFDRHKDFRERKAEISFINGGMDI